MRPGLANPDSGKSENLIFAQSGHNLLLRVIRDSARTQ
jgi:hypothetical protein